MTALSWYAVCLFLVADGATSSVDVSPVQKVVQLLDELKGKVSADLANEEKMMEEYTAWCDSEANSKEDAITSGKRTIRELTASIEDSSATIDGLTTEIEELAAKISTNEADLSKAKEIRANEHSEFEANEKELVDTVDTLDRAIVVLKRGQTSFLQSPRAAKELKDLAAGLSAIVSASWVSSGQRAMIQSLIQSEDSSEDEDLTLQPQATTAAFTSQGGGILDTLADMNEKAQASLSSARATEMKSNHAFQLLEQGLQDELATMRKRMSEATSQRSASEEAKSTAEGELSAAQEALSNDESYLADLKRNCAAKSSEWEARQQSAADEMAAIEKAKGILESGVKAFVQVSSRTTVKADDAGKREDVSRILRDLSKKHHSFALAQIATAAMNDPFAKVKGLIETMIERLTKEAAEEASTKSFCDEETSESKAKQADLTSRLDMHATRIEKSEAGKAKLQQEIKALEAEIAAIDAGQSEATKLRQSEHAEFEKASKDYRESAEAVASATQVLQEYYQGSFVQVSTQQPEFSSAKSDVASTIMGMLEVAESDFTRLLAEAEASESESQTAYDKMTQDNKVTRASKSSEAKGKASEVKSLERSLLNYKEDHASTGKELDAVLAYLDKLKPQCETKVMTYAERKAKREQEIEGLKEALQILEA